MRQQFLPFLPRPSFFSPIKRQFIPSHQQTDPILSPLSLFLSLIKLHSLAMNTQNQHQQMPISRNSIPRLKLVDFSLRLSVIPLSLASLWLTVTNNDDNPDYGSIKFLNFLGLKYMAAVAAIAAVYAIFAAISHWFGSLISKVWVFFISDQVMAYLMVTSGAAGGELMYLAYKGDVQVTWSEACSSYGKFCSKLKIALVLHFLAVFCFLVLAVISAFRAFSMFDPPIPSSDKQVDHPQST